MSQFDSYDSKITHIYQEMNRVSEKKAYIHFSGQGYHYNYLNWSDQEIDINQTSNFAYLDTMGCFCCSNGAKYGQFQEVISKANQKMNS